jgi:predicted RND superfamily exporter protein
MTDLAYYREGPSFKKSLLASVTDIAVKFSYQAYKDGEAKFYILPGASELKELSNYQLEGGTNQQKFNSFLDSTKRYTRVSFQMADIGSANIKTLLADISPRVDSIFPKEDYNVHYTGHSLMFLKGNDYLLDNLIESLIIEIILIALVGMALFRSFRIIILSKIPCLIPLIITAGIMGYLGIRFKPSTILIFSIAFGISSDGTIYFLTKYRHELKSNFKNVSDAISATIKDTGLSMIYTAVILFFGFSIFAASSFGGTKALGILISITLLVAMITNLILLPCILISIDKWVKRKEFTAPALIEINDEDDSVELEETT